jgi:uridine phosphorylase
MSKKDAIVAPRRTDRSPDLAPSAVIAATPGDLALLSGLLNIAENDFRKLFVSRLFPGSEPATNLTLVGPAVGAPYAAMLLETIVAWGARRIVFLGWCGAIDPALNIGDVVLPPAAIIDEGTSRHYEVTSPRIGAPGPMQAEIEALLSAGGHPFHKGAVWTTDGVYRETPEKVNAHRRQGAIAVEMETSALFSVGHFRSISVGSVLVVSDDLSGAAWKPGFRHPAFIRTRRLVCKVIIELCRRQSIEKSGKR